MCGNPDTLLPVNRARGKHLKALNYIR